VPSYGSGPASIITSPGAWPGYEDTSPPERILTIAQLRFAGAVEFGSRALGVENEYSDYDFAILRSNFEKLFENSGLPNEYTIKTYFKVIPPYGNNSMARGAFTVDVGRRNIDVDLLVLEHQEHLNTIATAVSTIQVNPRRRLFIKAVRIELFEQALLKEGFRLRWPVAIARWLMKTF